MEDMNKLINRSKLRHYLLLVSVISLCSSLLLFYPSSLLRYFNLYNFSSLPSQILSHTIDKNCMFLLCNGLLVFVSITRSFSNSDPVHDHEPHSVDDDVVPLELCSSIQYSSEIEVKKFMADVEEEDDDDFEEEEGKENGVIALNLKEEEEKWMENEEILLVEESMEEENLGLSTEQMNKKFDDFIRKMKADLRIEAKRQLAIV